MANRLAMLLAAAAACARGAEEDVIPSDRLLLLRAGDPADGALTSDAAPYALDVIDVVAGVVERTISLQGIAAYASSGAEGTMTASGDQAGVVISGYSAPMGTPGVHSTAWDAVARAVAVVDCRGGAQIHRFTATGALAAGGNVRTAAVFGVGGSHPFYLVSEVHGVLMGAANPTPGGGPSELSELTAASFASPRTLGFTFDAPANAYRLLLSAASTERGLHRLGGGDGGVPVAPGSPSAMLPGFEGALPSGSPHQWVFEAPDTLWVAEVKLSLFQRDAAGGAEAPWSRARAIDVPPHPDDDAAVSPGLRAMVGRTDGGGAFRLYAVAADALGALRPRLLSYTPAQDAWATVATSPSTASPYKGVALPPACTPVILGPTPGPMAAASASASPLPPPTASVSTNATAAGMTPGQLLTVSVRVWPGPSAGDFLGLFPGSGANVTATAPMRVAALAELDGGRGEAYLSTGDTQVRVALPPTAGGVTLAVMRARGGGAIPAFDAWLSEPAQLLPGLTAAVRLPLADPAAPTLMRVTPGSAAGHAVVVSWTTSVAAGAPTLRWWPAGNPAAVTTTAAVVLRLNASDLCPDNMDAGLRSIATAEGWADTGFHFAATLRVAGGVGVASPALPERIEYVVGDAAPGGSWSAPTALVVPPPARVVVRGGGAGATPSPPPPVSLLLVADQGVGGGDDTRSLRDRGADASRVLGAMAAEVARPPPAAGVVGVVSAGDLSYGDGLVPVMVDYAAQMSAHLVARVPLTWVPGNHETAWGGLGNGDVWARATHSGGECGVPPAVLWPQPGGATPRAPWAWSLHGPVAVVGLSTEHDLTPGSPQAVWLAGVLGGLNRSVAPWVVVAMHRPMGLASAQAEVAGRPEGHLAAARAFRRDHLAALAAADVTLVVGGHHHSYQRVCPLDPGAPADVPRCAATASLVPDLAPLDDSSRPPAPTTAVYADLPSPVHLNVGNGGVPMDAPDGALVSPLLEVFSFAHGFARLTADGEGRVLEVEVVDARAGAGGRTLIDRLRITQDPAAVVARQRARAAAEGAPPVWGLEDMVAGRVGRATPAVEGEGATPMPTRMPTATPSIGSSPSATATTPPLGGRATPSPAGGRSSPSSVDAALFTGGVALVAGVLLGGVAWARRRALRRQYRASAGGRVVVGATSVHEDGVAVVTSPLATATGVSPRGGGFGGHHRRPDTHHDEEEEEAEAGGRDYRDDTVVVVPGHSPAARPAGAPAGPPSARSAADVMRAAALGVSARPAV